MTGIGRADSDRGRSREGLASLPHGKAAQLESRDHMTEGAAAKVRGMRVRVPGERK